VRAYNSLTSLRRAAIASSSLRRCPNETTPSSYRSSAVKFGRTVSSISFSRKTASHLARPSDRCSPVRSFRTTERSIRTGVRLKEPRDCEHAEDGTCAGVT
jgi:hypothetical protein